MAGNSRTRIFRIPAIASLLALGILAVRLLTGNSGSPEGEVLAVALQSDGKAILAGRFEPHRIERRNTDGTLDETFVAAGALGGFNGTIAAIAIQPDDRIVVVGEFTSFDTALTGHVARLLPDGQLDTDFARAIGTGLDDPAYAVALEPDGKILIGGEFGSINGQATGSVARLNPDGTPDAEFPPEATGRVLSVAASSEARPALAGGEMNGKYLLTLQSKRK